MKAPPFLIGSSLVFWGLQTGFLLPAVLMAVILESSRWVSLRWELSEEDFSRIWIFCTLLLLGAAIYAFTANEGPADFRGLFENPNYFTQRNAGTASARTAAALIRWLPMIFFLFIAAQAFCPRAGIPLETISLIMRLRWKRAQKKGQPAPPKRSVDISFAYFALCLFAASSRSREDSKFFWGLAALLAWALWSQRSRRFRVVIWGCAFATALLLGYGGQRGIGHLQRYLDSLNSQWLASFSRHRGSDPDRSKTAIGQIGRIKTSGKIVIRLEPREKTAPPALLREASYRIYKDQASTWYAGAGRSKNDFETIPEVSTNKGTWVLLADNTNTACVRIACYLDRKKGLLPLAEGTGRLENCSAYVLYQNKTGAVLAEGPGLVMFDDRFGPGQSIDSPSDDDEDMQVPPSEREALRGVIQEMQLAGRSRPDILRGVAQFFQKHFTYSMWQAQPPDVRTNRTSLGRFLTRTRSGHCEFFASATVLLMRELGLPARYAVGYVVHESSGKKFVVRQRDAHAWCLVWNQERQTWDDFDTTPASWMTAEATQVSPFQFLSDAWSRLVFEFSRLRWGQTPFRQYLLWSLVPILGVLLFQIIFRSRSRHAKRAGGSRQSEAFWPGLDSEFYELEARLTARGIRRGQSEPLSEWLTRATAAHVLVHERQSLRELLGLHYRYRFDPVGLKIEERDLLRRRAKACLSDLKS